MTRLRAVWHGRSCLRLGWELVPKFRELSTAWEEDRKFCCPCRRRGRRRKSFLLYLEQGCTTSAENFAGVCPLGFGPKLWGKPKATDSFEAPVLTTTISGATGHMPMIAGCAYLWDTGFSLNCQCDSCLRKRIRAGNPHGI